MSVSNIENLTINLRILYYTYPELEDVFSNRPNVESTTTTLLQKFLARQVHDEIKTEELHKDMSFEVAIQQDELARKINDIKFKLEP